MRPYNQETLDTILKFVNKYYQEHYSSPTITNLIYASVDPKTVQDLAGHENSKITMDIYAKAKYNRPKDVAPMLEHVFKQWNDTIAQ